MRVRALLLIAAGLVLVAAAPGGDDAKKMHGTWDIVEYEIQGTKMPAGFLKKVKVIFEGDKFKFDTGDPNIKQMTYKIDAAKKPKQIDVTTEDAGAKTEYRGIYQLDGDTLKMCVFAKIAERPTDFKSNPDVKSFLMVLKKQKAK